MQVGTASIEKSNHARVDMPDLVRSGGSNPDFRWRGVDAPVRTSPLVPSHEPVPGGRRGEDLAEALCQQSQGSRGHVAVRFGSHHLLDRLDLGLSQLLWQRSWTRRPIVKTALILVLPRVVARRRQPKDSQHDPQGKNRTGPFDDPKQRELPCSIGNSSAGEGEAAYFQERHDEPKQRIEPFDPIAKHEHFLLKPKDVHVDNVEGDDLGAIRGEPAVRRGAGDPSSGCVLDVSRRLDQFAKAMIIRALLASHGCHDSIISTTAAAANHKPQRRQPSPK